VLPGDERNRLQVKFRYESADAPLGMKIAMLVAPAVDGAPERKHAVRAAPIVALVLLAFSSQSCESLSAKTRTH
jgi:hypothetical protein